MGNGFLNKALCLTLISRMAERWYCVAWWDVEMIENEICAFCCTPLIKVENQPNSRSVEHLIPNAALTRKRKNDEGDFYACRRCNARKSHIDNILGKVTKMQSPDDALAADTLISEVIKGTESSKRFIEMLGTVRKYSDRVELTLPIEGDELFEYMTFLGKGQYLKKTGHVFNEQTHVMSLEYINKEVFIELDASYQQKFGASPFRDLEKNIYSEVVNGGQCIIWSKNDSYLFIFHDNTAVIIEIMERNPKNEEKAKKSMAYILTNFRRLAE